MKNLKKVFVFLVLLVSTSLFKVSAKSGVNYIDQITNAYLEVKNALIAGNGTEVENKAKLLLGALSAQPDAALKPEQQKMWNIYVDKLKYDSRHMSETNAISHQREHFASLSKNMYEVLKYLKMNTVTLYQQYCPMKKAYWMSETAIIKNPYYGSQMLECGTIKDTLKPISK